MIKSFLTRLSHSGQDSETENMDPRLREDEESVNLDISWPVTGYLG